MDKIKIFISIYLLIGFILTIWVREVFSSIKIKWDDVFADVVIFTIMVLTSPIFILITAMEDFKKWVFNLLEKEIED